MNKQESITTVEQNQYWHIDNIDLNALLKITIQISSNLEQQEYLGLQLINIYYNIRPVALNTGIDKNNSYVVVNVGINLIQKGFGVFLKENKKFSYIIENNQYTFEITKKELEECIHQYTQKTNEQNNSYYYS